MSDTHLYFPPPGHNVHYHDRRTPGAVGLDPAFIDGINRYIRDVPYLQKRTEPRWALWRHGYLVHVEGDFYKTTDVASLRKTWHALIVGAAIKRGKIPSLDQKISTWLPELKGPHAEATWRHVITQSAGFDYPHREHPAYAPGEMWTYSDWNLVHLCNALAHVYGKHDFYDHFYDIAREAYFDAIGLKAWTTRIVFDRGSGMDDGVRFCISLEHMGRLGLFALARGAWNGHAYVDPAFVEQLETKQTRGMKVNYDGPYDGKVGYDPEAFPEVPYGFLTWVNTDGDLYPGCDKRWASGRGAGGSIILWNRDNGLVFTGFGINSPPQAYSIPRILEEALAGSNPLAAEPPTQKVGRWHIFETHLPDAACAPANDVALDVTYRSPDGRNIAFWGFRDTTWKCRFMPDQPGVWTYKATFSDGASGASGTFECVPSDVPGLISRNANNPTWFGYAGGDPARIRSLHVGDCFFADEPNTVTGAEWNPAMRTAFLDWAQAQGYNMLSVASHYLNRRSDDRGNGWQTPDLWDRECQSPRPAEYHRMETVLDDLAHRKILVYPFAGFFGRDANCPADPQHQDAYIRYTLARLAPYWNLLFMVGGPEPHLKSKPYLSNDDINRIGRRIRDLDPFGHLLSVHNPTGDDMFRNEDWVSYVILQGPKTVDRKKLGDDHLRNSHPQKPLYAQETLWPGNTLHSKRIGRDYSPDDIRKNAFVMLFSGATINFADMDGLSSSGFSGRPDLALKKQAIHDIIHDVWDTFETFPFHQMRPKRDIADNGHCLASDNHRRILVYLDASGSVRLDIEGSYRAEWINARHPTIRKALGVIDRNTPLYTPNGGGEWILDLSILER